MKLNNENNNATNLSKKSLLKIMDPSSQNNMLPISPNQISDVNTAQVTFINDLSLKIVETNKFSFKNNLNAEKNHQRIDRFGNRIIKKGKHKVSFIDKITKTKFEEVINVECYKSYNKMETVYGSSSKNGCCEIM